LWFSLGTPVSSTNKTDIHDITEILLKVALNTITLTLTLSLLLKNISLYIVEIMFESSLLKTVHFVRKKQKVPFITIFVLYTA
jgi:hypothetical protein